MRTGLRTRRGALLVCLAAVAAGAAAGTAPPDAAAAPTTATLRVVAAENVWGSIAAQLGGRRVTVESIIDNPATDPHTYQPVASDARAMAASQLAVVNGIGYDRWASQLLAANPSRTRVLVDVGTLLGLKDGANPHQWYAPASVRKVIGAITAGYIHLDPAHASYFAARKRTYLTRSLARYDRLRAEIRRRFAGVPVGYSESLFQPLGANLGLRLLTPYGFAKAVAEGAEIGAGDKQTVDRQVQRRQIAVWVYNSQNLTPEVQHVNALARARRIPVVAMTETLSPATFDFQQWQVAQLERLLAALHRATGR